MKDWYLSLEYRDRLLVGGGAVVVVLVLMWTLLWLPLDKSHQELRISVDNWAKSLKELQPLRAAIQSGATPGTSGNTAGEVTPIVVVDQTLSARGLNGSVKTRTPTPNGIRIEFEDVAFDDLILWLGDLSGSYSMEVQAGSMSVARRAGPGRINASLTLERSP